MILAYCKKSEFYKNDKGAVAVIFGTSIVLLVMVVVVLGIETSSARRANSINQGALDSAVLAAASYKSKYDAANPAAKADLAKVTEVAKQAYLNNLQESGFKKIETGASSFTVAIISNLVAAKACVESARYFSKSSMKACGKSAASFYGNGAASPAEVVFALDISSSMGENAASTVLQKWDNNSDIKLNKVVPAMRDIVTKYSAQLPVYWGVVPYRGVVNIFPYHARIVEDDLNNLDYSLPTNDLARTIPAANPASTQYGYTDGYSNGFNLPGDTFKQCYISGGPEPFYARNARIQISANQTKQGAVGKNVGMTNFPISTKSCVSDAAGCGNQSSYNMQPSGWVRNERYLMSFPLTERKDGTVDFTDDSPPNANKKFKAYWHHDQKITFGVSHEYGPNVLVPITSGTACGRFLGGGSGSGGTGGGG